MTLNKSLFKYSNTGDSEGFTPEFYSQAAWLLSEYIKIPTVNPPGNEEAGLEFLKNIFKDCGLNPEILSTAPGRDALVCAIPGSDPSLKPIVVAGHVDVVPADEKEWEISPFSGAIKDGFIWGRGALDMKGMGIMELMAFLSVYFRGIPIKRGIAYLALPDEENGGKYGARIFAERFLDALRPELILNEGSFGVKDLMVDGVVFPIAVTEKVSLKLRLIASGRPGHSSMPDKKSALSELICGLSNIQKLNFSMIIHPIVKEIFRRVACRKKTYEAFALKHPDCMFVKNLLNREVLKDTTMRSLTRTTIAITVVRSGDALNAIPGMAEAYLDVRILPETDPASIIKRIEMCLSGLNIEIEPVSQSASGTPTSYLSPAFLALEEVLKQEIHDAIVVPTIDTGSTDSKYFRAKGIPCYDLIPCILSPDDLLTVHGKNEKISIANLNFGIRVLYKALCRLCNF